MSDVVGVGFDRTGTASTKAAPEHLGSGGAGFPRPVRSPPATASLSGRGTGAGLRREEVSRRVCTRTGCFEIGDVPGLGADRSALDDFPLHEPRA
ncbi:hypothetical protein FHX42_002163 [Saccharopolyspora lacisalsi]|uniref:Uncharacterized protein n=1 Tax=Halosaccharopolyspora lacisalsi TaxID=1000566 RepID=A0A839DX59_9PSEU|nr:hypothetical protein [Halosaccharopolyspora lacisalsi]